MVTLIGFDDFVRLVFSLANHSELQSFPLFEPSYIFWLSPGIEPETALMIPMNRCDHSAIEPLFRQ